MKTNSIDLYTIDNCLLQPVGELYRYQFHREVPLALTSCSCKDTSKLTKVEDWYFSAMVDLQHSLEKRVFFFNYEMRNLFRSEKCIEVIDTQYCFGNNDMHCSSPASNNWLPYSAFEDHLKKVCADRLNRDFVLNLPCEDSIFRIDDWNKL